jgi:hypothetical protein
MDNQWENQFRKRMDQFARPKPGGGIAISIKIRVTAGCFHRQHSPQAYDLIDQYLKNDFLAECRLEEHESGPELLLWLALGTAGLTLAKSVIDLITTIIKARSEGIKKGDYPSAPIELIVRSVINEGEFREEKVLRFNPNDMIKSKEIENALIEAIKKINQK